MTEQICGYWYSYVHTSTAHPLTAGLSFWTNNVLGDKKMNIATVVGNEIAPYLVRGRIYTTYTTATPTSQSMNHQHQHSRKEWTLIKRERTNQFRINVPIKQCWPIQDVFRHVAETNNGESVLQHCSQASITLKPCMNQDLSDGQM